MCVTPYFFTMMGSHCRAERRNYNHVSRVSTEIFPMLSTGWGKTLNTDLQNCAWARVRPWRFCISSPAGQAKGSRKTDEMTHPRSLRKTISPSKKRGPRGRECLSLVLGSQSLVFAKGGKESGKTFKWESFVQDCGRPSTMTEAKNCGHSATDGCNWPWSST